MGKIKVAKEIAEGIGNVAKKVSQYGLTPERSLPRFGFGKIGEPKRETSTKTVRHQVSQNVLKRPIEEMSATYSPPRSTMKEDRILRPDDLKVGDVIIPAVGDTTLAGHELRSINDIELDKPVNLQGGGAFARDNPDVWASDKGAISALDRRIERAHDQAKGGRVLLAHTTMAGPAVDFAQMPNEIVRQMLLQSRMADDPSAINDFDKFMRETQWTKDYPPVPKFPGLKSDELEGYLRESSSGTARKKMIKGLAQDQWQARGAPDVASARWSTIEPSLLNQPSGMVGHAISEVQPGGIVSNPEVPHPTYNTNYSGNYLGRFEEPIPRDIMLPEFMAKQEGKTNRSQIDRAQLMGDIRQPITQEIIEKAHAYLMSREGRTKGIVGLVGAGIMTEGQARELFGEQYGAQTQ
jgi:hypothetical protein